MSEIEKTKFESLPNYPGVGYKPQHFAANMENASPVKWLEIHAENYMGQGGRPIAQLRHLAWSTHDGNFMNDLLPLPYTKETAQRVADHVSQVQDVLGRKMLLENPSAYLAFRQSTLSEIELLNEVVNRTGCGLLLDINNVFISSMNQETGPRDYIDQFPLEHVGEFHLGGHDEDEDETGAMLLIDSHGREMADPVWELFAYTLEKSGPRPALIEWDANIPEWPELAAEAVRAAKIMGLNSQ